MTTRELKKAEVMQLLTTGNLTTSGASQRLGLSDRQIRRLRRRFEKEGSVGMIHGSRGKKSGRALNGKLSRRIRKLLNEKYADFGPTFASEKILEEEGIKISREKLRQIQIEEGLWKPKARSLGHCHPRRKRRSCRGELLQTDGSDHDWLEGRGPRLTLLVLIDDATSEIVCGRFFDSETTFNYMHLIKEHIEDRGIPEAIYSDKHSIFRLTNPDSRGRGELTNLGKALRDLDIELICANSPQAKGRVERSFGVHQDRLVKELRLAKISTKEGANEFLKSYFPKHNDKFSVPPALEVSAYRELPEDLELNNVLCVREDRKLSKNLTFQYENVLYQVDPSEGVNRLRHRKIEVRRTLDGCLVVLSKEGKQLKFSISCTYAEEQKTLDTKEIGSAWIQKGKVRKPSKHHPWRKAV